MKKSPAEKYAAGLHGEVRQYDLLELVRDADIVAATVTLPREYLARVVVLERDELLVGQVGALHDEGQALQAAAVEAVADLGVVAAAALDGLLDAGGTDARQIGRAPCRARVGQYV